MTLQELLGSAYREGMTLEEINEAMASVTLPDNEELAKARAAVIKANGEAAEWKRKYRSMQSEEDAARQQREEEHNAVVTERDNLRRELNISRHSAKFLEQGYDAALAASTAEALVDGDFDKVFANQKTFMTNREKQIRAEIMRDTPRPGAAGSGNPVDYTKEIDAAIASGDTALAAALVRKQHEASNPTK